MISFREAFDSIFTSRNDLLAFMRSGLGNIMAIAETLRPECERLMERSVSAAALSMALRRYLEQVPAVATKEIRFPKHIEITTRSAMYEVALARTAKALRLCDKVRRDQAIAHSGYLSVMEGAFEIVIVTSMKHRSTVRRILGKTPRTSEINNIATVTVNWPAVTKDIPGIYARVTRALAQRQISIQSFHTIGAEMSIFVKEDVVSAAHQALMHLLNNELR